MKKRFGELLWDVFVFVVAMVVVTAWAAAFIEVLGP